VQRRQWGAVQVSATVAKDEMAMTKCPRGEAWAVHKFGGTCVATPERILDAARLMVAGAQEGKYTCVVVSAMGSHPSSPVKTTDLLINMVTKAANQDAAFLLDLEAVREKHVKTATQLLGSGPELNQFVSKLSDDMSNLKAMLKAISIGALPLCHYPWSRSSRCHTVYSHVGWGSLAEDRQAGWREAYLLLGEPWG
jgi:hypothetical protein